MITNQSWDTGAFFPQRDKVDHSKEVVLSWRPARPGAIWRNFLCPCICLQKTLLLCVWAPSPHTVFIDYHWLDNFVLVHDKTYFCGLSVIGDMRVSIKVYHQEVIYVLKQAMQHSLQPKCYSWGWNPLSHFAVLQGKRLNAVQKWSRVCWLTVRVLY